MIVKKPIIGISRATATRCKNPGADVPFAIIQNRVTRLSVTSGTPPRNTEAAMGDLRIPNFKLVSHVWALLFHVLAAGAGAL